MSEQGDKLVKQWVDAKARFERLKGEQRIAEIELRRTEDQLGKWIAPKDIKEEESIALWTRTDRFNETLLIVRKHGASFYVTIRETREDRQEPAA